MSPLAAIVTLRLGTLAICSATYAASAYFGWTGTWVWLVAACFACGWCLSLTFEEKS